MQAAAVSEAAWISRAVRIPSCRSCRRFEILWLVTPRLPQLPQSLQADAMTCSPTGDHACVGHRGVQQSPLADIQLRVRSTGLHGASYVPRFGKMRQGLADSMCQSGPGAFVPCCKP